MAPATAPAMRRRARRNEGRNEGLASRPHPSAEMGRKEALAVAEKTVIVLGPMRRVSGIGKVDGFDRLAGGAHRRRQAVELFARGADVVVAREGGERGLEAADMPEGRLFGHGPALPTPRPIPET